MKKRNVMYGGALLVILLAFSILYASSVGAAGISPLDSLKVIVADLIGYEVDAVYQTIIWNIRLPRILLSALVGGALSMVGAAFQGVFRNPLADPHVLGVSSGAALGATIAMMFGVNIPIAVLGTTGAAAFVFALGTVFLVYQISMIGGISSSISMVLAGTAIGSMLSAVVSLLLVFRREDLEKVYSWTLGSFSAATWEKNLFLLIIVGLSSVIFFSLATDMDILCTGEEEAKSLGVDTAKLQKIIIVVASILVAAAVSVSGVIGFVGLMIPHCVRMIFGPSYKYLFPFSLLLGASFMVICDTIARTVVEPTEISVGIITALFGGPYFLFLLAKEKGKLA